MNINKSTTDLPTRDCSRRYLLRGGLRFVFRASKSFGVSTLYNRTFGPSEKYIRKMEKQPNTPRLVSQQDPNSVFFHARGRITGEIVTDEETLQAKQADSMVGL